jgi:hypothetical protein
MAILLLVVQLVRKPCVSTSSVSIQLCNTSNGETDLSTEASRLFCASLLSHEVGREDQEDT